MTEKERLMGYMYQESIRGLSRRRNDSGVEKESFQGGGGGK